MAFQSYIIHDLWTPLQHPYFWPKSMTTRQESDNFCISTKHYVNIHMQYETPDLTKQSW